MGPDVIGRLFFSKRIIRDPALVVVADNVGAFLHGLALDQGLKGPAVQALGNAGAGQVENGGHDIRAGDQAGGVESGLDAVFPIKQDRAAVGKIVHAVLTDQATAGVLDVVVDGIRVRFVLGLGLLLPAVVADVDKDGVIQQPPTFDMVHQLAHTVVPPGDIAVVGPGRLGQALVVVELAVLVRRIQGHVGQCWPVPDHEGLLLVAIDEIEHRLHGGPAQFIAVAAPQLVKEFVGVKLGHVPAVGHALGEVPVLVAALPVLAAFPAGIAFFTQEPGQGLELFQGIGIGHGVPHPLLFVTLPVESFDVLFPAFNDLVLALGVTNRVQAGQQGAQGGPAVGRC